MLLRSQTVIAPGWEAWLRQHGLDTVEGVYRLNSGESIKRSGSVEVRRVQLGEGSSARTVFIKKYWIGKPSQLWSGMFRGTFFGRPKARGEYENLARLRVWQLDAPAQVAYGEERRAGWLMRSFLISEGVPEPMPLHWFIRDRLPALAPGESRRTRRELIENLAGYTRRLHERGFVHHDYFWRNILLSGADVSRFFLIDARYQPAFAALGLNSFDSIAACFASQPSLRKGPVLVKQGTIEPPGAPALPVFFKQYEHASDSWKFWGRRSKARCEYENYEAFVRLGVDCAQRVACGEQRASSGRLRRAFIITVAIPAALNLVDFLATHCPKRATAESRDLRASLRRQLAGMTRRIHQAGFFHHDLVWRNILVNWQPPAGPKVWWIDCPRGQFDRWSPWRHRRLLKDLASLDKSASKYCTRGERLAFIKEYLDKPRLDAEVRQLARAAIAYRKERWPEDWNGR